MKSALITFTFLALIAAIMVSCEEDGPTTTAPEVAEGVTSGSYFGVDPEDKKAVEEVQRKLGQEKFHELFGHDIDLNDIKMDYPDRHPGQDIKTAIQKLKKSIGDFFQMVLQDSKNPKYGA